jgi:hypothetical protein
MIDPNKYRKASCLKASDLRATRTRVRIDSATEEQIGTPAETKLVLHFTTAKLPPRACNYGNVVTLVEGFGPDEQTWVGKLIVLLKTKAMYQGKLVDSIAIEIPPQPTGTAPVSPPPLAPVVPSPTDPNSTAGFEDEADLL